MKKATSKLLLFFFCMSFLMVIPKKINAAEIIPVNIPVEYGQTEARTIFDMINEMRTDSFDAWYWNSDDTTKTICDNLSELAYDYDLERLAMKRAAEIALSYDHTRPNGERCFSIYTEEGITYRAVGENIAAGYLSAEKVNAAWREDDDSYSGQGHRRNMLSSKFNCVGIGHVYYNGCHYWAEEFAYRPSVNTTETAANDSEQAVTLSIDKSKITNFSVTFDKTSYILRTGETVTPNMTATIAVSGQWPRKDRILLDMPAISVDDTSIATYSNGQITGVAEGKATLTASLYGLTATDMPTILVHECDNHWDQGEITKKPTCKEEGEKTFTCTICSNTKAEKVSTINEHSWDAGAISTEPTCTEEGVKTFTCKVCDITKTENVSATGHLHSEIRNVKAPTCKEEGYTGDTYCTDCDEKISSGQAIAKTENHSWDDGIISTEPTCTEEGVKTFTCKVCSNTKTEKVSATGHLHSEIRNVKAPTCKEEGYTGDTYCTDCDEKISSGQAIAKTENHSWDAGAITTEPTCTKKGLKTFTCNICGNTKTEKISATGHLHTEIRNVKHPTCKEEGNTGDTYCIDCDEKISSGRTIAKTKNHNWDAGKITTEPSCTTRGEKTFTCSICGNTKTTKISATGHIYGEYEIVKEPTTSERGLKSKTCSVCGRTVSYTIPKAVSSKTDPEQNQQTSPKTTKKIKLNRRKLTLKKGRTFRLKVTLTPINSQDKILYRTSNKKVARVNKNGKIKAIRKGRATITVISGKKQIVCKVTVK